jgi:hypothetical protein
MKINKILGIDCTAEEGDFFSQWIEYLAPKHHLTKSEQKFLAACLRQRHELSKGISDENLLDETALNETYRTKLRQELGISAQQMQNIITKLKKLHILIPRNFPFSDKLSYYKIAPSFIPNYNEDEDFLLLLVFKKKNDRKENTGASIQGVQSTETKD